MATGGERDPKRQKPSTPVDEGVAAKEVSGSGGPAMALLNLTVANADALHCVVCSLSLKPPIFQCDEGHMVCSPCSDKLKGAGGKCHVCGVAMAGGYRRCHGMERLVDSLRAACPNAAYGCAATPPYHGREEHIRACPHPQCYCPGEACGFAGSTAALRDHIASAHGWPYQREPWSRSSFNMNLRDGFNFVVSAKDDLFLLNVTRHAFFRTVSVVCIRPRAAVAEQKILELQLSFGYGYYSCGSNALFKYDQKARFPVAYSDLSDGLTDFNDNHQLILLNKCARGHEVDKDMEIFIEIFYEEDL